MSCADESEFPQLPEFNEIWQQTLGWHPTPAEQQQFQRLYELVLEGNRQLNLTRITAPEEFWEKHLWDSLSGIANWLGPLTTSIALPTAAVRVIDIGSGGGFPGIPVALVRPQWSVTLLEATRKKVGFQSNLVESLSLPNIKPQWGRAEELARTANPADLNFDLATVRAVGPASRCAEYALPLLRPGGLAVLYRGQWAEVEAERQALKAVLRGRGQVESVQTWLTPLSQNQRHCLYLRRY
jgi:16S rRNA (guanine527-N7)-methyltransferase